MARAFREAGLPVVLVTVDLASDGTDAITVRTAAATTQQRRPDDFAALRPELDGCPGDIRIVKRGANAFYGTELDLQLRRRHVTGIVLAGIATSMGVESTARAANDRAFELVIAADATTDFDADSHEHCMRKAFPRIAELASTDEIAAALLARHGGAG